VSARNALLAVPASVYGRAYGCERAMDNLGAIFGPLLALGLVALVGVRTAILVFIRVWGIGGGLDQRRLPESVGGWRRGRRWDWPAAHRLNRGASSNSARELPSESDV
jgi:hypothetical protein